MRCNRSGVNLVKILEYVQMSLILECSRCYLPASDKAVTSSGLVTKQCVAGLASLRPVKFLLYDVTIVFFSPFFTSLRSHWPMHGPHAFASTFHKGTATLILLILVDNSCVVCVFTNIHETKKNSQYRTICWSDKGVFPFGDLILQHSVPRDDFLNHCAICAVRNCEAFVCNAMEWRYI